MHPTTLTTVLENLEQAIAAAFLLIRELHAAQGDDDGWTRLPNGKTRCKVSKWSRSTILRHIKQGTIRSKLVKGSRFYSAGDVRQLLTLSQTKPTLDL